MENKHTKYDLAQMQSLPLEHKIIMTKQRIKEWYNAWKKYEIVNKKTGKVKYKTSLEEPELKENEYINSVYDGQVYISFSGGKDSSVLLHIARELYPDIEAVFVNTGLEYPEIQKFVKTFDNVTILTPDMKFPEVIKKYGYPMISKEISDIICGARKSLKSNDGRYSYHLKRLNGERKDKNGNKSVYNCEKYKPLLYVDFSIGAKCCNEMKKKPVHKFAKLSGKMPITAQMASESRLRMQKWLKNGCNGFQMKAPISNPMSFWTEQDILEYLYKYEKSYCKEIYGDVVCRNGKYITTGCSRTGCIFCGFGCHLEKSPTRFERLKETHLKQYNYCLNGGEYDENGMWIPNKEGLGMKHIFDSLMEKVL